MEPMKKQHPKKHQMKKKERWKKKTKNEPFGAVRGRLRTPGTTPQPPHDTRSVFVKGMHRSANQQQQKEQVVVGVKAKWKATAQNFSATLRSSLSASSALSSTLRSRSRRSFEASQSRLPYL